MAMGETARDTALASIAAFEIKWNFMVCTL